ncbi:MULTISPECIES: zinc ribbon domain-containing protein [unclassified Inquilinus]|uniref:zinc ribbon domain-containing protein n=1 Tax=unclassified Inquilinus TaxID=2645927 RepID=UPI003F92FF8D
MDGVRAVSGPTLLTGICFCATCGGPMTLRTGKSGRYRYYTCSTAARQGVRGCPGQSVWMDKLDRTVVDHLEWRLLDPRRLQEVLKQLLERRDEWVERRRSHIAELRKRTTEAEAKLKRLYQAIEDGAELAGIRDQARADAERVASLVEGAGSTVTPDAIRRFARAARRKLRNEDGTYRRDHLRALAQRVEVVDGREIRITGSKAELLRALTTTASVATAALGVPSFIPKWRAMVDENEYYSFAVTL